MILLDAVYINSGGGLVLLKSLIDFFEKRSLDVFYLFDNRTKDIFKNMDSVRRKFINNYRFY